MSLINKIMLSRLKRSAVDKESAKKNFHTLEKKRIAIQYQLNSMPDNDIDKIVTMRHKSDDYDEVLKYLANKAGLNYDESEIGRLMRNIEEECRVERERNERRLRMLNSDDPEEVRRAMYLENP